MENKKKVKVERYTVELTEDWNNVLVKCFNGSFLLKRSFIEYHQDRYEDFSYVIWYGNEIVALFAAAINRGSNENSVLTAHPGLTYGGLVHVNGVKYAILEEIYRSLFKAIKEAGFAKLLIKQVPQVFCSYSNDASLFFLYKNDALLVKRELNSIIDLTQPLAISKGRKDNIRKARNKGVVVQKTNAIEDYQSFWQVLIYNLQQAHGAKPVHTFEEISLLHRLHPDNITLYTGKIDNRVVGGVVLFHDDNRGFAHTQYISANEEGKTVGAVDVILMDIILEAQIRLKRFSFGTSTLNEQVNYGLLNQKEGFGSNAEVIDTYSILL